MFLGISGKKGETTYVSPGSLLLLLLLPARSGLKIYFVAMCRSKDTTTMPVKVKGNEWAIRITMVLTDEEEKNLCDISGSVIVYHAGGSRKGGFVEKPHYHCYMQKDTDRDTIAKIFLANSTIQKYHKASNAFWMIDTKSTYSLSSFWDYVWKDFPLKRQRLVHWGDSRPPLSVPELPIVPIATGPIEEYRGTGRVVVESKKTSLDKQRKFLKYCQDYYGDEDTNSVSPKEILGLLYDYCRQNGHTTEACCFTYVNFVISNLHTDEMYEQSKRDWSRRLLQKFF